MTSHFPFVEMQFLFLETNDFIVFIIQVTDYTSLTDPPPSIILISLFSLGGLILVLIVY